MKADFSVQNNVVNVCCSYLSMVLHFTERPFTTVVTPFFAGFHSVMSDSDS